MARRKKQHAELWLGVLVIVSAILLTWGYFWLTGQPLGERGYTVSVLLEDSGGLERGDRVRVSGVEVGVVRSVQLADADQVVVTLWLQRSFRFPEDSRALLQSVGVFGDRFIELIPGRSETLASEGDTIASGSVTSLTDLAGNIGDQAEAVLLQVEKLLADSAIDQVHGGLAGVNAAVRELEVLLRENGDDFAAMSRSVRRTAETLEETIGGADIERTIADLEKTAATLAETAEELRGSAESLRSVTEKIDSGQGTIGLLVNDPGLYNDLRKTLQSVGSLTQDMRENPGRYLKLAIF